MQKRNSEKIGQIWDPTRSPAVSRYAQMNANTSFDPVRDIHVIPEQDDLGGVMAINANNLIINISSSDQKLGQNSVKFKDIKINKSLLLNDESN